MEEFLNVICGFVFGVAVCSLLFFLCATPHRSRSLEVDVLKTQKQECLSLMGFNGQPLVLCPDECATFGKLELCNRVKGEKE
jgi:hypothetical protein